jgi:hypothetical protein
MILDSKQLCNHVIQEVENAPGLPDGVARNDLVICYVYRGRSIVAETVRWPFEAIDRQPVPVASVGHRIKPQISTD